jgi:hypothetical protein
VAAIRRIIEIFAGGAGRPDHFRRTLLIAASDADIQ